MREYKIIISALLLVFTAGCKKSYFDINRNPNTVTESNVTAELILPNALSGVGAQATGYGPIANWVGYWSPSGSFAPNTEESTYNITNSFLEGRWTSMYNVLFDLNSVEVKATAANQPFYRAVAMIMKAHLFQNLVDLYGDVPYSEAFNPAIPTPKYDNAQQIYSDLQIRLDTAINIMKTTTVGSKSNIPTIDIVYKGSTEKWVKLANTLKLRLLIRQSQINPNPTAELAKIQANPLIQSGEGAEANPGYVNDNGKQNPFYASYGFQVNGNAANDYYRANSYIVGILKSNNDPRLGYFFRPATSPASTSDPYLGTTYGAPPNDNFSGTKTSNIGAGLTKSATQSQWIVTSIEALFLQAEAVARGWLPGNAQTVYESAVRESFIWLGVPNAVTAANTYMTNNATASWANAGTTTTSKVNFVVYQKYIALTGINPLEAYNDYRRLKIPANIPLSVNPARGGRVLPVRLLYPSNEVAVNSGNIPKGQTQDTPIFWMK